MGLAQQRQENLLSHIISGRRAAAHQQRESEDAALIPPVDAYKRLLVAGRHQPKQFVITWSYQSRHSRLKLQLSADMGNSPGETKIFQNISQKNYRNDAFQKERPKKNYDAKAVNW